MKNIAKTIITSVAFLSAATSMAADLSLANFMSPNHPYEAGVFKPFAESVKTATAGEVTVTIYSGGELGTGPKEQYNRAVDGVADFAFALPGYTASHFPTTLLTELPGIISEERGTETLYNNLDYFADEFRRVKLAGIWTNAENVLYTSKKAIRQLEDLKGLKIRAPSKNAGLIIESWGATPVSMPVTEIYNAMQTGVIDGAFIDGTASDSFKLGEVAQYITQGMNSSISVFAILMNRHSFADLSQEQQQAVLKSGREAAFAANRIQLANAHKALETFGSTPGKELITLSPEAKAAFDTASESVIEAIMSKENDSDAVRFILALQGK